MSIDVRAEIVRYVETICPGATLTHVAGDASTRRFHRLHEPGGRTRVIMDYGQPFDGATDDQVMARIFREAGLPVAEVVDASGPAGCLVLEDLGPRTLQIAIAQAERDGRAVFDLLARAARLAAAVAERGTSVLARSGRASGPALDPARFQFEMAFFEEHFVRGLHGWAAAPRELSTLLRGLADRAADTPRRVLCHRDFHSRNLMVLSSGQLAMVDIQDARWGPDTYDLASLLYDAYIDIEPAWRAPLAEVFREALADPPPAGELERRLAVAAAQRMLKALGTFGYQLHVRGNERYRPAIPRTLERLRVLLPSIDEQTARIAELLAEGGVLAPR